MSFVVLASACALALAAAAAPAPAPSSSSPPGVDAFMRTEVARASLVAGDAPAAPDDPRWASSPALTVLVAPQHAVHLGDRDANAHVARPPRTVEVRALVTHRELALRVEWRDDTRDVVSDDEVDRFGDSVAVEVPLAFGAGRRLPYVGMGDDGARVAVFMQRATAAGSLGRDYVAAGFGSLTRAGLRGTRMAMSYDGARRTWRAVFVRPLDAPLVPLRAGLVPFAVAVWDGALSERGGNKATSSWKFVRVDGEALDETYAREVAYGFDPAERGDVVRGKQLVESVCVACHRIGAKRSAMADVAPDLTNVGVVSTYAYLRESIVDPSAVVVPILNINRHQARSQPTPDASGAFASNEQVYRWWATDAAGKKVSRMMSFASLPAVDVAAMVTYLKTLGVPETIP